MGLTGKRMKVIIVGGVAGGASCAARLRRLDENTEIIMVERGPYVSYANSGLPYHISGVIAKESSLMVVASEGMFRGVFGIDARTNCEAIAISRKEKTVQLLLFNLLAQHYERRSAIITSNLASSEWGG